MKILITGGCKNGKSTYAQDMIVKLSKENERYYIATMKPTDEEDILRIKRHIEDRDGYNFVTIEQHKDIANILAFLDENSSVLLDSSTALLANEMFLENEEYNQSAYEKISEEIIDISNLVKNIVVVSDYIYSDAYRYEEMTENYKFGLAYIDKRLAKEFDVVIDMCFSIPIFLKGEINI